jgi:hypothetical protein
MLTPSVRIEAHDRQGLERLLRYCAPKVLRSCTEEVLLGCARPAFAQERLRHLDPERLVYESKKPGPGAKVSVLLTPRQLLVRVRSAHCVVTWQGGLLTLPDGSVRVCYPVNERLRVSG